MYDNIGKRLVESFPEEFSTLLLGKPVVLTELKPTELSIEPIRADSVLLRQSEEIVLHVFKPDQTQTYLSSSLTAQ